MLSKEKKMLLWWSFFITVFATIYAVVYTLLPIPSPVMWCTYVSLPIFFAGGAKLKDIPSLSICAVCGFLWGIFCLWLLVVFASTGAIIALTLAVFISVLLCCFVHMAFFSNTFLNKTPMVFGAFACCFASGGENGITICLTLIAGICLAGIMSVTGKWANALAGIEEES